MLTALREDSQDRITRSSRAISPGHVVRRSRLLAGIHLGDGAKTHQGHDYVILLSSLEIFADSPAGILSPALVVATERNTLAT